MSEVWLERIERKINTLLARAEGAAPRETIEPRLDALDARLREIEGCLDAVREAQRRIEGSAPALGRGAANAMDGTAEIAAGIAAVREDLERGFSRVDAMIQAIVTRPEAHTREDTRIARRDTRSPPKTRRH
jgi:hypothetical protein